MGFEQGVYTIGKYTIRFPSLDGTPDGRFRQEGWEFEMGGTIEGLTGIGIQLFNQAVSLIQALPVSPPLLLGAALPGYAYSILQEYSVRPRSNGVVEFGLHYHGLTPSSGVNVLRVGVSAQQVQTNLDILGNRLIVSPPASITGDTLISSANQNLNVKNKQTKTVSVFRPQATVEVTRLEIGVNIIVDASLYVGSTNTGPCPWDKSAKPRTWMCMGIESESHDLGITYVRVYRFQRAQIVQTTPMITGWDTVIAWIDPRNGNAPSDINVPITAADPTSSNAGYSTAPTQDFSIFTFLFPF